MNARPFQLWLWLFPLLVIVCGCSCERNGIAISLTRDEIQERVNTRFPIERSLLMVGVTLRDPKVILNEGSDRIGTELNADVTLGPLAKFSGAITVSGVPVYDPTKKAFFLSDPTIDRLQIPGMPPEYEPQARQAIDSVVKPTLREVPVYELQGKDAKEVTAQYALREVRVKDGKLQAILGLPK